VTYDGTVKVLDFGIAKAAGGVQTAHGVFKGKVAFMAPEQVVGENVDRRADIFAAGIVLWEAISGQPLLAGDSPVKTLHNLLNKELPRLSTVKPIPEALDDVVAKALERKVEDRFQTAKDMRDALEAFLADGTPVTHEEVGELTQTLFADTRAKIQAQIKTQLATLSLARTSTPSMSMEPVGPPSSGRIPALTDLTALNTGDTSPSGSIVKVESKQNEVPEQPSRMKRLGFAAWIGLTLITLGVSTVAIVRSRPSSPSTPPPPPASTPAIAASAPPPVASIPSAALAATPPPEPTPVAAPASASAKPDAGPPKKKAKPKPKPKPSSDAVVEEKTEPPKPPPEL
jgi:serine/threonine-protein kinase